MANEKLTAKQILDRAYTDAMIENLEQRQREIEEDIENTLRPYRVVERDEAGDDFESEPDTFPEYDDVQLNWQYEEDEDWENE